MIVTETITAFRTVLTTFRASERKVEIERFAESATFWAEGDDEFPGTFFEVNFAAEPVPRETILADLGRAARAHVTGEKPALETLAESAWFRAFKVAWDLTMREEW